MTTNLTIILKKDLDNKDGAPPTISYKIKMKKTALNQSHRRTKGKANVGNTFETHLRQKKGARAY